MSGFASWLIGLPGLLVYVVVGMLVFAEDALFFGFVLPGEAAAVVGGLAASRGHVTLPAMIVVVVVAATAGDTVGYAIGRRLGLRLLDSRVARRNRDRVERARRLIARRGGFAVLLGRFTAFLRAVVPVLAGAARMPYRTFLVFNVSGAVAWGLATVLLGHLAGHSYASVETAFGRTSALAVTGPVAAGVLVWYLRRLVRHVRSRHRPSGRSG